MMETTNSYDKEGMLTRIKLLCDGHDGRPSGIAELERDLQFPRNSLHKWKTMNPSWERVVKVANRLNVSTDYLTTGE